MVFSDIIAVLSTFLDSLDPLDTTYNDHNLYEKIYVAMTDG